MAGSSTVNMRPPTETTPKTAGGACGKGVGGRQSAMPAISAIGNAKWALPRLKICNDGLFSTPAESANVPLDALSIIFAVAII
jgi:hypothetical protein